MWPAGAGASRYDGVVRAADSLGAGVEAQLGGLAGWTAAGSRTAVWGLGSEVGESVSSVGWAGRDSATAVEVSVGGTGTTQARSQERGGRGIAERVGSVAEDEEDGLM